MEFQGADFSGQRIVVGGDQTAFGTRHVFDGVEGENRGALRANPAVTVFCARRVRGIFNDRDTMLVGHGIDRVKIQRRTGVMDRNNGFGFWGDRRSDGVGADHQGVRINIDHDRFCTEQNNHIQGRNPGLGRSNDFIAGTDAQRH
ncbi:hypothetical protein D3C80_1468940 [compost metagenome]